MIAAAFSVLIAIGLVAADLPADFTFPEPPGPHVGEPDPSRPLAADFRAGEPLVATTYFYWYDAESKAHIVNHDGSDALTDHPPTLDGFSYKSIDWHAEQLTDMMAAGIDVAMPVYWGSPAGGHGFSDVGLPPLVAGRQRLIELGKRPPAIGLFYDTSTLQHNEGGYHVDLTTDAGRRWFYGTIRNFFSLIPPDHRATIDGRPLVFLYASAFAKAVDEQLFPATRKMFRRDFGTDLYLVKMDGWPGEADSRYQWGGALRPQLLETAGIGPGYDHSAVPGRTPLVRSRDDGRFYEFSWHRLLSRDPATRPWLVHVETWNEFHEGTEICETIEYGRQYIDATRKFADQFRNRAHLRSADLQPARKLVEATPEETDGLTVLRKPEGDGPIAQRTIAGRPAWTTVPNRHSPIARYMYFEVDDYFFFDGDESFEVTVEYLDEGAREFMIEYDSSDPRLSGLAQQFRAGPPQPIGGSGQWKVVTMKIQHARFAGRSNDADFRLNVQQGDLAVSKVTVRRVQTVPREEPRR
ncbi:MAG: DUF5010 domain-containing protein [Pirellulaceae bacterium]|nr:DUF5010 domain-containing protein [Pirellulaceae bacterium]